jgi:hypothetical protein
MLQENPLAVGTLAVGVGAAVGLAIPETSKEHEVMGEARDNLVDKAQEKVQETQQKVQQVAGRSPERGPAGGREPRSHLAVEGYEIYRGARPQPPASFARSTARSNARAKI